MLTNTVRVAAGAQGHVPKHAHPRQRRYVNMIMNHMLTIHVIVLRATICSGRKNTSHRREGGTRPTCAFVSLRVQSGELTTSEQVVSASWIRGGVCTEEIVVHEILCLQQNRRAGVCLSHDRLLQHHPKSVTFRKLLYTHCRCRQRTYL